MNLSDLQKSIAKSKFNHFLITRNNMFLGQDILPEENIIQKLTGFSGSAGILLITPFHAWLFVDGRYELQAAREVNPQEVSVVCQTQDTLISWLKKETVPFSKSSIGCDSRCLSIQKFETFRRELPEIKLDAGKHKLFTPLLSTRKASVFEHDEEYAGESREEKLNHVLAYLKSNFLNGIFIGSADSVSWLLNLRSRCLPDTPVMRAMALVDYLGNVTLFADNLDFGNLQLPCTIQPLKNISKTLAAFKKQKLAADMDFTPQLVADIAAKNNINLIFRPDICQSLKAVKNPVELGGIEKAHQRDGAAVCKFLCWFEKNRTGLSELDVVAKLKEFRQQQENFFSDSFDTIAGFGANGAIVHYRPEPNTNLKLEDGSLLLLDSGAQYYDGTTDITRTIAVGIPSPEMIEHFTHTLKAHIALNTAIFPEGTPGRNLDALARRELWNIGLNYNHGTGHGVGCFLNVHEGPISISSRGSNTPLLAGMVTSIEPGCYFEGKYGIRIENLVKVTPAVYPGMLKFENLTLVPIDKRLINKYLLNEGEADWLNRYHKQVYEHIKPLLDADEQNWLKDACSPL